MGIAERKEREKEERRTEILRAAEKVFFEKGLAQATMDEIAERAELSKATLYLYYGSKEDLYLGVECRGKQILNEMFEKAASTGQGAVERLQNIGKAYFEFYRRHRDHFRMFAFSENNQLHSQVSEEMLGECSSSGQKVGQVMAGVIKDGINEGVFRSELDPFEMTIILWRTSKGIIDWLEYSGESCRKANDFPELNLQKMLTKANAMVVYAMLTDEARKNFKLEL